MTRYSDNILSGFQATTLENSSMSSVLLRKTYNFSGVGNANSVTVSGTFPPNTQNLAAQLFITQNASATVRDKITVSANGNNLIVIDQFGSAGGYASGTVAGLARFTITASACSTLNPAPADTLNDGDIPFAVTFAPVSADRTGRYQLNLTFNRQDMTFFTKPLVVFDFKSPNQLPNGVIVTGDSNRTYFDRNGTLQSTATNAPRWTYDFATGQLLGMLNEPARTNYVNNTNVGASAITGSTNLLTNGDFTTDLTGWNSTNSTSAGGSTAWHTGGGADLIMVGAGIQVINQGFSTVIGQGYTYIPVLATSTAATVRAGSILGAGDLGNITAFQGSNTLSFVATTTTSYVQIRNSTTSTTVTVTSASVLDGASVVPTNWRYTKPAGVGTTVTGLSTIRGMPAITNHIFGLTSSTVVNYFNVGDTAVVASNGQTWAGSFYQSNQGPGTNLSDYRSDSNTRDGGGLALTTYQTPFTPITSLQRIVNNYTITDVSAASTQSMYRNDTPAAVTIDNTATLAGSQLELGVGASSIILTGATPVVRAVETVDIPVPTGTTAIIIIRANGTTTVTNPTITNGYYRIPNDLSPLQVVQVY